MIASDLLDTICAKNRRQQKKLSAFLEGTPAAVEDLDRFLRTYSPYLESRGVGVVELADAYLQMLDEMLMARIHFTQTNEYPRKSQAESLEAVYQDPDLMTRYMLGLALSQFLWEHHYRLLSFFRRSLDDLPSVKRCLEVGSGHGLYSLEALARLPSLATYDIVDISQASLDMTRGILQIIHPEASAKISFVLGDVGQFRPTVAYDYIMMGEVLEHVEQPLEILVSLRHALQENGRLFVSTCVNSPAIDHVYHFRSVDQIRSLLGAAGFVIQTELIAPSENVDAARLERYKLDISYAAILSASSEPRGKIT